MARRVRLREALVEAARRSIGALCGQGLVRAALAGSAQGPCAVWAVGKAAPAMARGAADALGKALASGLVIARAPMGGEWVPAPLALLEAAHPFPDERSVRAADTLLDAARALAPSERAILLLSGGASSLIGAPVEGLSLTALSAATRALLERGAPIGEINVVRRHLGRALGGRLAQACTGRLLVLAISDVAGDDLATIGSGPAAPDPSTREQALAIARRYALSAELQRALDSAGETPKPDDPIFSRVTSRVLAGPESLRATAAAELRALGFSVRVRERLVSGSVESFAAELGAVAGELAPGVALVAVGEPTVTVRGSGSGGRAQHLALLVARAIAGTDLLFLALGSDGSDGPGGAGAAAGAIVDGDSYCPESEQALADYDSHSHLAKRGCTIVTGPTGTNLTDQFILTRPLG